MTATLSDLLKLYDSEIVSVIGCQGDEALIELLCRENSTRKVLVSTTTTMTPADEQNAAVCHSLLQCISHKPQAGAQYLGIYNPETMLLEALPDTILMGSVRRYSITLIKADESGGRPCKGWLHQEPVVPAYTSVTLGVMNMEGLGKPATKDTVHNLSEFLALTRLREGMPITYDAMTVMVCGRDGMFRNAVGRKCLVVNADPGDAKSLEAAHDWLRSTTIQYPGVLDCILLGSMEDGNWIRIS